MDTAVCQRANVFEAKRGTPQGLRSRTPSVLRAAPGAVGGGDPRGLQPLPPLCGASRPWGLGPKSRRASLVHPGTGRLRGLLGRRLPWARAGERGPAGSHLLGADSPLLERFCGVWGSGWIARGMGHLPLSS